MKAAEWDEYEDIKISTGDRIKLFERILDTSPTQYIGDGRPDVDVSADMAEELERLAKIFRTSSQRVFEAAFIAWAQSK
jgi:hypothetical protein